MDYIKNKLPKLSTYDNDKLVSDRKELDEYTLLHFGLDDTNPYTMNEVKAFDNQDGTEIAKSSYMYVDGELKYLFLYRQHTYKHRILSLCVLPYSILFVFS